MLLIYIYTLLLATLVSAKKPSNAILLSTVKTLTLRGDQLTSARRVKAVPQLKCIGGSGKGLYEVDVMRCKNTGSEYDAEDISWTCQAQLPPEFKLGSTDVICEGYNDADDPYVLKGSCGVEYRLALTDMGEAKYGKGGWRSTTRKTFGSDGDQQSTLFSIVFWLIFLGIVLLLAYKFVQGLGGIPNTNRRPRRPYGAGYGGPGNDDDDDPPPPYSRRPPQPRPKTSGQPSQSSRTQQGWRPGFWSGTAAGAAAGYAMGSRNSNRNAQAQAGPSNWFNTGARNTAATGAGGNSGSSIWGSNQASSSSPSSARYESSGFGGTRRR